MKPLRERDRDEIMPDTIKARALPTCPRCERKPEFRLYPDMLYAREFFYAPTCCGVVAEGDAQTDMNEDWRQYAA